MPTNSDILIIGAGVAGLYTALKLAPRPVTVVTARPVGEGASSPWAQGGMAAAVGPDDTPNLHFADTVGAGDTFCGYLGAALDAGLSLEEALRRAAVAGSLACLKSGAQPAIPLASEVEAALDAA